VSCITHLVHSLCSYVGWFNWVVYFSRFVNFASDLLHSTLLSPLLENDPKLCDESLNFARLLNSFTSCCTQASRSQSQSTVVALWSNNDSLLLNFHVKNIALLSDSFEMNLELIYSIVYKLFCQFYSISVCFVFPTLCYLIWNRCSTWRLDFAVSHQYLTVTLRVRSKWKNPRGALKTDTPSSSMLRRWPWQRFKTYF